MNVLITLFLVGILTVQGCEYGHIPCLNGIGCVDTGKLCDGKIDCFDGSDELLCEYNEKMFTCGNGIYVLFNSTCNGLDDCIDGSDEVNCTYCYGGNFLCNSKRCIDGRLVCNGKNDCGDYSDELICMGTTCGYSYYGYSYNCGNNNCYSREEKCNGINDCGNFRDEKCELSCTSNMFRCTVSKQCIPLSWRCDGAVDCENDETNCACPHNKYRCETGGCVSPEALCDGIDDCADRSDENDCETTESDKSLTYKENASENTIKERTAYPTRMVTARASIRCPRGKYGTECTLDCNCKGICHPVSGHCTGGCMDGWYGPSCQIEKIQLLAPEEKFKKEIAFPYESIDGNLSSCPVSAIGFTSTWWQVNISKPVTPYRIRIYNKKDTRKLKLLENLFRGKCEWNWDYTQTGHMDVICKNATKTDQILLVPQTRIAYAKIQICEFQVIVCSNHSFGPQCESTCNCKNRVACDVITGECPDGCLDGMKFLDKTCGTSHVVVPKQESYQSCRRNGAAKCKYLPKCIAEKWTCDGNDDCGDNSDEENCQLFQEHKAPIPCNLTTHFMCEDSRCLSYMPMCYTQFGCADWSDEKTCRQVRALGQNRSVQITVTSEFRPKKEDIKIKCQPVGNKFLQVKNIELRKSTFTSSIQPLVVLKYNKTQWRGESWIPYTELQKRATVKGYLDTSAHLSIVIPANQTECSDAGTYTCVVTWFDIFSGVLTDEASIYVTAIVKPDRMNQMTALPPPGGQYIVGRNITLSCIGTVGSYPNPPSIMWCIEGISDNTSLPASGVQIQETEVQQAGSCQYKRTSTMVYTVRETFTRFTCQITAPRDNGTCGMGTVRSTLNIKSLCFPGTHFVCDGNKCHPKTWKCDGYIDCTDSSDERNCPQVYYDCGTNSYMCNNGTCIPINLHCDGLNDCGDWSDEIPIMCKSPCHSNEFTCNNSECLPSPFVCNGIDECGDNSDETDCRISSSFHVSTLNAIGISCSVLSVVVISATCYISAKRNARLGARQTRSNLRTVSGHVSRNNTRRQNGGGNVIIGRAYSETLFSTEEDNNGSVAPPTHSSLAYDEPPADYFSVCNSQNLNSQVQGFDNRTDEASANRNSRNTDNQTNATSKQNSTSSSPHTSLNQTVGTMNVHTVGSPSLQLTAQMSQTQIMNSFRQNQPLSLNTSPEEHAVAHNNMCNSNVNTDEIVITVRNIDHDILSANDRNIDRDSSA